jgi:hypothetical protein
MCTLIIIIIIIIILYYLYSTLGPVWAEIRAQATGMALVNCILGTFLGDACHCFPPLFLDVPTSPPGASTSTATREILAAEGGTVGANVFR